MATGAAVLRHRVYDLERIISRTLAYGLLTLLVGGFTVVVQGSANRSFRTPALVAGATLAVATPFQPAPPPHPAGDGQLFNRRRYDATQTMAAFSARLQPIGASGGGHGQPLSPSMAKG